MIEGTAHQRFVRMISRPESDIDLAHATLLVAQEEDSSMEPEEYLQVLDRWADKLRPRLRWAVAPEHYIAQLNRFMFEELGFQGNSKDYYDPENSFLNRVMDRRLGVPITLSVIYMEVARRVGFPVLGVGMPGHFLVKPVARDSNLYVDPYNRGQILTVEDCARRLGEIAGSTIEFKETYLSPVGRKQILARILYNLKGIYIQRQEHRKALAIVNKILHLIPDAPTGMRDRGMLHVHLGRFGQAIIDLQKYLLYQPDAEDSGAVRRTILFLKHQLKQRKAEQ